MIAAGRCGRRDEGQATVELALVLPAVVLLALVVGQVVLVGRDHLLVVHAARAGAREAAVDPRPSAVEHAVRTAAPALKGPRLSTETSHRRGSPDIVTVSVRYRSPTSVALVGVLLPDVVVVGEAAFRYESDT